MNLDSAAALVAVAITVLSNAVQYGHLRGQVKALAGDVRAIKRRVFGMDTSGDE